MKTIYEAKMRNVFIFIFLVTIVFFYSCDDQKSESKLDQLEYTDRSIAKEDNVNLPSLDEKDLNYIPGEILIKFKDGTDVAKIRAIQERFSLKTINIISEQNLYRMKIQNGSSVEEVVKGLTSFREVEYSEPSYIVKFK